MGTEGDLGSYVSRLAQTLFLCRRLLKPGGFICLIIEPLPGYDVLPPLASRLKRLMVRMLATYRWSHGDGSASWIILLGKGPGARLNQMAGAWQTLEWAMRRPPPDAKYGFYEWPQAVVEAILDLTIPNGGRILDPFAGKAAALGKLDLPFEVVAVDVLNFDDEDSSANESGLDAVANQNHRGGSRPVKETS